MELITLLPTWVIILAAVILVATVAAMAAAYFKDRSLEEIRSDTYRLILEAEHRYRESGQGKQKMEWVVSEARKLLPEWVQAVVSEEAIMETIQAWFDGVKDLLDDGKMNSSAKMRK